MKEFLTIKCPNQNMNLKLMIIKEKQNKKISKHFKNAIKAGLVSDYKDAASVLYRILWEVVPEVAEKLPNGDCSPRSFHKAWDEVKVV